jgi:hypothetical protein
MGKAKEQIKARSKPSCENCGIKDDLEVFEHVLGGIRLCQDCADLPVRKVQKRSLEWVKVKGEYFPPDFPIANRKE